jgi:hypothetical protein
MDVLCSMDVLCTMDVLLATTLCAELHCAQTEAWVREERGEKRAEKFKQRECMHVKSGCTVICMYVACMLYVWGMYGLCMLYVWTMYVGCMHTQWKPKAKASRLIKMNDCLSLFVSRMRKAKLVYLLLNLIRFLQKYNTIIRSDQGSPYNNNRINLTLILLMGREKRRSARDSRSTRRWVTTSVSGS